MDVVGLYYSNMDVQPIALLRHFLRYLAFYVEENPTDEDGMVSVADIYVISDEYMELEEYELEIREENKTIFVLKDGWHFKNDEIKMVYYNSDAQSEFLDQLVWNLCDLLEDAESESSVLMQGARDWRAWVSYIAQTYQANDLLKTSLFSRCFFKKSDLFQMAKKNYIGFLSAIESEKNDLSKSDLCTYVLLYAKYELDIVYGKNYLAYPYTPGNLLEECEALLDSYPQNEELHLLRADILYELRDKPWRAYDLYADVVLERCAYAHYKRGKILRAFFEEYESAEYNLRLAIKRKPDYHYAKYQLAECYENQSKYKEAIHTFTDIYLGLERKYKRHILAPLELEYMYKALMKIASIYKNRLSDYDAAYMYDRLAQEVRDEHAFLRYVEEILEGVPDSEKKSLIQSIEETMMEQIDLKIAKIY